MNKEQFRQDLQKHSKAALARFIAVATYYTPEHTLKVLERFEVDAEIDKLSEEDRRLGEEILALTRLPDSTDPSVTLERLQHHLQLSNKQARVWKRQNRLFDRFSSEPPL